MSQPAEVSTRQWLDRIPHTWAVLPAKALFSERREPCHADDVHLTPSQTYGVLPQEEYITLTGSRVVLNLAGQDNMKHVEPNDFIIHLRSFQGGLERSALRGKVSTAYTVLTPRDRVEADYYKWLLKCSAYIQTLRTTTNQLRDGQSIKFGDFAKVALPAPSLEEQRAIANFLDRETTKIDALVAEQEGLIAVLKERRAAVISRAIGPDTGPLTSLGRLGNGAFGSGTDYSADEGEPGWPRYVRTTDIAGMDALHSDTVRRITVAQAGSSTIRRNDILFTRSGSLGTNYLHESDEVMAFAGYLVRFRPNTSRCVPRYVAWWSQSRHHLDQIAIGASKSTIDNFSGSKFRAMRIPTPSLSEQQQIADYLDEQTSKIDTLIAEAQGIVALAGERRAALVTAAVTGQIDVRGEVA